MNTRKEELQDRAIVRIAAHLPDLIVYGDFSPQRPSVDYFDGVLMFVDISGFTAMTEKFSTAMYMDRGAEQLVEILNYYISAIVEKVLIFGGDILKFAGDALLALWKVERKQLKNIITVVIKCSLEIHGLFGTQESEEGLDIRVKIGLAAGHISMLVFGDETRNHFLVIGQAVDDVRLAQNMARMNDVILSPNCWQLCDRSMIEIERIPDQRAVKVNFLKPPPSFNFDEFFNKCMTFMDYYPSGDHKNLLRLACMLESDPDLELSLQKYVMESILKQIDDKQLRGYLSELRPVTIVFVNLMFQDQNKAEVIGSAIQDACVHISSVLKVFRGQINKVFMFDKGCSFLCVFGFPGEKAPDEVTHALESAVDIFDFCSQVHKIHTVSIGVASGIVFCGIVGHTVRHEYTVIGQKVNIAARMMMYYPGIVTCDSVTYNGSNLPPYFFKELPKKLMKGVGDSGPVYQCLGLNEKVMFGMAYLTCNRNEGYPLLGRDKEIKYFMCTMKEFLMSNCSRVLMYEGLSGFGKSRILMEIEYLAQGENHRTIAIALTKVSFHQNFYTIQILMANVLGLDTCKHYKERQTNLQNKVKTLLDEKFHCLLNDIFHVQFPISREISKMSTFRKQKQLEALFMKILEQTVKEERIIFIIDEAQFVDYASWIFMEKLIRTVPIFIIMSLSPFTEIPCAAASAIMKNRNTTYVTLGAVQPNDIRNKVCLDLNVSSIPKELDLYLVEGSCGIPFYCEELVKNLDHHRVLVFQQMETEEKTKVTWNNLFKNFIKPTEEFKMSGLGNEEGTEEICKLASGVRLKNLSPPASLKEISLVQLDSMSLSHQMLVRCAAIIGLTFTTELLFEILPCWNMKMMIKALATLVESNIFDCFRDGKDLRLALKQNAASFEVHNRSLSLQPTEGIAHGEEEELRELESEVIECHIIRFCKPMMQKTAYELWLKDQKKAMHLKCARFLEENAHRCDHCRSGDFIPYHHFTVDIRLNTLDMDTIKKMATSHGFETEEEIKISRAGIPKNSELFSENLSPEEIGERILGFFDVILTKMKTSKEDIIPLESCQCEEILEIVILPLAQHFLALGENNKALYYFLEITSAYLTLGDNYMAYMYLNEGERLLKTLKKEKSWSQTFESATFYSLKGQVCFNMGQMVLAKKMLRKALKLLNRIFPYNLISLFLHTHMEKNRHFHYVTQQAQESSPPGKKRLAHLYQQTACFSLLWQIYSLNYFFHHKYYGHLAAMMELNTALETQNDFQIIKAYLDYAMYHHLAGYQGVWFKYEVKAMEQIFNLPLKGEGIEIVAYVAGKLSYIKLMMGYLDLAIELGARAHKMWALLQNPNQHYVVLCRLSKSLFLKNRYKHLIQMLRRLWDLSVAEGHIISKAFFYLVCLDIMLYSGFVYRTFEECLEFIIQNEDNRILKFQSGLLLGLYSSIAIWYGRLQEWDNFYVFSNRAKTLVSRRTPTILYYDGVSRYMEGQVLQLQKQIEEQSETAQDSGVELLKSLESLVAQNTTGPVFYPRLYHLMAYICILMGDGQNCDLFLNTALKLSEIQGNVLEKCWLNMSKEWWYSNCTLTEDQWLHTILSLPAWEKIVSGKVNIHDVQKNKFLMRVNILDNPF
ncbi:adenylate cyclase type 10 [Oryctolagus cuniculus]|uniref:Adenylate cyclase type 10 n=1 Tax=Oryctolagus cuniculus TaxID=9986 RepID=ADCYA_RABIT|nr:adenylate cyclase type 10 [Oryctolagus cuniculus]Q866F4.1 RecName: Full=Adenylate cyclase type 10; AltName: Full=Germ cell soluble adenylyl cyclase; Short=sAC; AltName: Full=Testicular soluble adenylyl cyclase [Oryctolagus cuniculus]AAO38673.1 soluble adenylyl cyclase [Oryctolagus cuniculus]